MPDPIIAEPTVRESDFTRSTSAPDIRMTPAAVLALSYLAAVSLEAPVRFYLGSLAQAKDLFLVGLIVLAMLTRYLNWRLFAAFAGAVAAVVWGLYINRSGAPMAVVLGLKQALPWLAGLSLAAIAPPQDYIRSRFARISAICFFSGVLLLITGSCAADSVLGSLPWSGSTQIVMGQEVETSREWSADSVRRVAGTARSSFDAAAIAAISALILGYLLNLKSLRLITKTLAIAAIYLTTSKAALVAFLATALLSGFMLESDRPGKLKRLMTGVFLLITLVATIVLPLSSLFEWDSVFRDLRLAEGFSGASFAERQEIVWPQALRDVIDANAVLGFGIGGVGAPLSTYAPELYVPTDNLFVYLLNLCGVVSFPLLLLIVFAYRGLERQAVTLNQALAAVALFTLNYGITASVLECSWLSLFLCFGMATGLGFSPQGATTKRQ